jgi:DNA-binding CsgD family transcriptional regulator
MRKGGVRVGNVLGLGSILLWQWLAILKGPMLASLAGDGFWEPRLGYIFFSAVLCGTFFVFSRWGAVLSERWFRAALWGAAVIMSAVWLPWGAWIRGLPLIGTFLFLGLPAVGSAIHLAAWEWRLCGAPFPRQAVSFGYACAARTGCILLVSFLFPALLPVLATTLPFLGASLWAPPEPFPDFPELAPLRTSRKGTFPPRLALRAGSFFAVSAMFLSILLERQGESLALVKVLVDPFYTAGALGVGFFLTRLAGTDLRRVYVGAEVFLGLGFLIFAALGETHPFLPLAFLQLGAGIFGAYIFTLLLYLGARAERGQALSVVTTGQMVITGSVLLGMLLAGLVGALAEGRGIAFELTASLLGMGLLFFSKFFFRDDRESFAGYDLDDRERPGGPETPGETPGATVPEEIPAEGEDALYLRLLKEELSRQEIRVALLVARGLSNETISQSLNVTGNTVRTHLKNIPRKIGTANRKELQDRILQLRG